VKPRGGGIATVTSQEPRQVVRLRQLHRLTMALRKLKRRLRVCCRLLNTTTTVGDERSLDKHGRTFRRPPRTKAKQGRVEVRVGKWEAAQTPMRSCQANLRPPRCHRREARGGGLECCNRVRVPTQEHRSLADQLVELRVRFGGEGEGSTEMHNRLGMGMKTGGAQTRRSVPFGGTVVVTCGLEVGGNVRRRSAMTGPSLEGMSDR